MTCRFIGWRPGAVMTAGLSTGLTGHQTVIKGTQPGRGVMTGITRRSGHDVSGTLPRSNSIVVAVGTSIRGLRMINGYQSGNPGGVIMTRLTHIGGQGMCRALKWASTHTVMTTRRITGRAGLTVIERSHQSHKVDIKMTQLAGIHTGWMTGTLANSNSVVVTVTTSVIGLAVVKR